MADVQRRGEMGDESDAGGTGGYGATPPIPKVGVEPQFGIGEIRFYAAGVDPNAWTQPQFGSRGIQIFDLIDPSGSQVVNQDEAAIMNILTTDSPLALTSLAVGGLLPITKASSAAESLVDKGLVAHYRQSGWANLGEPVYILTPQGQSLVSQMLPAQQRRPGLFSY